MLSLNLPNNTTSNNFEWVIQVKQGSGTPGVRYDLSYYGDVGPSLLSVSNATRAAAGSVDTPASSPYALAVGAANVANNSLEAYSSQGPTIDRRLKPDITGFDNVRRISTSSIASPGTSAGAPHVAGAAALIEVGQLEPRRCSTAGAARESGDGDCRRRPADQSVGSWAVGARFPSASYRAGGQRLPAVVHAEQSFDSRTRSGGLPLGTGEQVSVHEPARPRAPLPLP